MITCLAIDDEPLALKKLVSYINKVPYLQLVAQCQSAREAQQALQQQPVDAMFIDINMPDLNGLDFVKSLDRPPLIVFTTAYTEYALEGYKVAAVDYLLKPYGFDEFENAAAKVKRYCDLQEQAATTTISQLDDDDAIYVKSDYKIVRVETSSIRYVEAMSEYLRIFSDDHTKPIMVLLSMKKMEEHLPSSRFMRIHRSYIINLKKIREVNKNHVSLDDDVSLPIGDIYKDAFFNYLNTKFLSK